MIVESSGQNCAQNTRISFAFRGRPTIKSSRFSCSIAIHGRLLPCSNSRTMLRNSLLVRLDTHVNASAWCLIFGFCLSLPPISGLGYAFLPLATDSQSAVVRYGRAFALFLGVAWCVAFSAYASGATLCLALAAQSIYAGLMAVPALMPGRWWLRGWMQMALPTLPPLAYWLPLPPAAGAGWLFPGTGYLGVALYGGVAVAIAGWRHIDGARRHALFAFLAAATMLAAGLNLHAYSYPPRSIPGWSAQQYRPSPPVPRTFEDAALAMLRLADVVRDSSATVIVAPENWLGTLPLAGMRRLREALTPGQRLLVGGISSQDGVLRKGVWDLPRGAFTPAIAPIPLIEEYPADYARVGSVINVAGQPASLLVCFEASTSLPLYHLHYGTPVILVANGWWDTLGALSIQRSVARSWARLFASPLLLSEALP